MDHNYNANNYMPMGSAGQHQPQYASFSAVPNQQHQQQQHQQPASNDNPTLPPLQPSHANYSHLPSLYTGAPHSASPHTPHTPHTPSSSAAPQHSQHAYSHIPVTSGSMPPPSSTYLSMGSGYATSHAPSHSSASMAPSAAPASASHSRLPDLRPMPQSNFNSPLSPFPPFSQQAGMSQQQYLPSQESEPTHVVGSQGRRGILPSAPGRAAPPAPGAVTASNKSMIPAKDADGKFPCPHCNKTYLHAKHLKRHLLRHTGDRPYMCHLCKDTFSRSDILKRHFQKCSIRRGNPTGANHLAHQRRNTNPSNRLSIGGNESIGLAGLAEVAGPQYSNGTLVNSSPTVNGDQSSYASSIASMSNRSSRANSLIHPPGMHADGRHNLGLGVPSLQPAGTNGDHASVTSAPFNSGVSAYMRPHSQSTPLAHGYSYGPSAPNGNLYASVKDEPNASHYAHHGGQVRSHAGMDWNSMFGQNGQDGFMQHAQQDQQHLQVKPEHAMDGQNYNSHDGQQDSFLGGMYSHPSAYPGGNGDDSGAPHQSG